MESNLSTPPIDYPRLFNEFIRFETELWDAVDARLREVHDLPLTWFEPMQVIGRLEICRVTDIAEQLSITVGGSSKLIDRIEASGLCVRRADPRDGRSSTIQLTPAGYAKLADASRTFVSELETCLRAPQEELERFLETILRLRGAVRSVAREPLNEVPAQNR